MSPITPASAPELEATWGDRVRANRVQAERLRETESGDLYAPVTNLFVADPRRTGEPALDALLGMAVADETWLDIGAGAGRYALPLALRVREVIAVEPSAGMRRALRTGMDEHGMGNVRVVPGTWPDALDELGDLPAVDVSLIAHVGVRHRGDRPVPGRDGGGDAAPLRRRPDGPQPGVGRRPVLAARPRRGARAAAGPARARGAAPGARRGPRGGGGRAIAADVRLGRRALTAFLRRQLFIAEGGEKDVHFRAILPDHIVRRDGGWTLAERPAGSLGIVTWSMSAGA